MINKDAIIIYPDGEYDRASSLLDYLSNSHFSVSIQHISDHYLPREIPLARLVIFILGNDKSIAVNSRLTIAMLAVIHQVGTPLIFLVPSEALSAWYSSSEQFQRVGSMIQQGVSDETYVLEIIRKLLELRKGAEKIDLDGRLSNRTRKQIHESTIKAYDSSNSAQHFYETWRNSVPIEKLQRLERHLKTGDFVLDAGCGPGHHSHYLSARGYSVTGIDLSDASLKIARGTATHGTRPTFIKMDMRKLQFEDGKFDAIWSAGSILHIPKYYVVSQLVEFRRVLRPGGHLGITTQVGRMSALEIDGRFFSGFHDEDEFKRHIEEAGFRILETLTDVTSRNTRGIRNVVRWTAIVAQAVDIDLEDPKRGPKTGTHTHFLAP